MMRRTKHCRHLQQSESLAYEEGDHDYKSDERDPDLTEGMPLFHTERQWCGQTTFVYAAVGKRPWQCKVDEAVPPPPAALPEQKQYSTGAICIILGNAICVDLTDAGIMSF